MRRRLVFVAGESQSVSACVTQSVSSEYTYLFCLK